MDGKKPTILRQSTLAQLRSLQHVVILKDSATVEQVLKTLATYRIISAPVVVAGEGDDQPGPVWPFQKVAEDVAGFVDVKDIIGCFLKEVDGTGILESQSMLKKMRALEEKGTSFSKHTLKDLKLSGGDGCFLHVGQQQVNLLELAADSLLNPDRSGLKGVRRSQDVHRIAIFDSSGRIVNIISQSDIVRFLLDNVSRMPDISGKSVQDLGMASKPLLTVSPDKSAIEALKIMIDNAVGALAVVNKDNQILGNFSASEMRTITAEHFGSLALPVGEFLALEHGTEYAGYSILSEPEVNESEAHKFAIERQKRIVSPGSDVGQVLVICKAESTLEEVMRLLVHHRIHRVFVVDETIKPLSVITCTDILRKLCELEC